MENFWNQDISPIDMKKIQITEGFWKKEMELVRTEVLPYQWRTLNDKEPNAAPSYCMRNFKIAGKMAYARKEQGSAYEPPKYTFRGFEALPEDPGKLEDKFYGFVFQDSDFSKWIEAVSYTLTEHPDPELEQIADGAIDIVCAAQLENGYLDTYYIINGMDKAFSNLRDHHELYCFGHLTEGAVAYYQATGKDKLLKAAVRFADYIDSLFGPEPDKCKGYPGHEIAEMALVRLYEVTGEKRYLELSRFFLEERGKKPYYFDIERELDGNAPGLRFQYHQAHLPVREQSEAFGHAVRAVYLYSGMADMARIAKDARMYEACKRLWRDIVDTKMYVTGGIGATHLGEAFSFAYDLPNDTAYAETCASIGLVFFAERMLRITPDSEYGDVMELALYNGILSGMAMDGKSFFYVNPLEVVPKACALDERKRHVKSVRQKWFGCACCPPNIARLLSSISTYSYARKEDTVFVHQYIGCFMEQRFGETDVDIKVESGFPWDGNVKVSFHSERKVKMSMAFRIPSWCKGEYETKGMEACKTRVESGYLYVTGMVDSETEFVLDFPMKPRILQPADAIREDAGKVALMRGPLVYCLEEIDNGANLHELEITAEDVIQTDKIQTERIQIDGNSFVGLCVPGHRVREKKAEDISTIFGPYRSYLGYEKTPQILHLVPYYTWNNRGEGEMQVFLRCN